mgnify:CR=1 FL=1
MALRISQAMSQTMAKGVGMNILPIINMWLTDHIDLPSVWYNEALKRKNLIAWLRNKNLIDFPPCEEKSLVLHEKYQNLIVDSLIAAGCGLQEEQTATVYCNCSQ